MYVGSIIMMLFFLVQCVGAKKEVVVGQRVAEKRVKTLAVCASVIS